MTLPLIERLTPVDLINIAVETPSAPARIGALALLDGRPLLDGEILLRMADIRAELERRIAQVPRLRQVIHRGGPLSGRPVWIDDRAFRIERHVRQIAMPDNQTLTDLAVRLVNQPMGGPHPMWRMWFVTGVPDGRIALVIGLHHVIADGVTTVQLIRALTDGGDGDYQMADGFPRPSPTWTRLVRDNLRRKASAVHWPRRPDLSQWRLVAGLRHAPRTSLNRPVGASRRLAAVGIDLADAKQIAHRHGGKVNDVVLALAAGGIRELLLARGEPVDGVRLNVSVAVSLRDADTRDVGNRSGAIVVRVPLDADPHRRLHEIAQDSKRAKGGQVSTTGNSMLVGIARLGLLRFFSRRQRMVNLVESNVTGPAQRLRLLGAPILEVIPIGTLAGNLAVGVLAMSYAGRLTIAVQADARRCPELPVMLAAMDSERQFLLSLQTRAVGPDTTALRLCPAPIGEPTLK